MPKQVYTWGKVKPGDIISFRYKGKQTTGKLATILVLNPIVKLSTEPRENELPSLDQNTKESRLPNVKVLESIVEVPARSTKIL